MALTAQETSYRRLRDDVERGVFPAGSRLPAERALAADLGISRMTLRAALGRLADEGRVERAAQRGWFVAAQTLGEPPSTLQSFTEMAASRGLRATARVLSRRARPATLDEADRLGVAPTTPLLEIERLRGFDGHPVCHDLTVFPLAQAPELETADLTDASLYRLLEDAGVRIHRSSYTVQAVAADAHLAPLLEIAEGAPVLVGSEVARRADGVPLLLGRASYRGDAYRFQADLFRPMT